MAEQKREAGLYLVPVRHEVDGDTGLWQWYCRIEEVDENGNSMYGPIIQHGGDTQMLNDHHEGEHEHFLLSRVKPMMLRHYADWKHDHSKAQELVGKSL